MTFCHSPRLRRMTLALLLAPALGLSLALLPPVLETKALAQSRDADGKDRPKDKEDSSPKDSPKEKDEAKPERKAEAHVPVTIKEPVSWRVYQRNSDDHADIPVVLSDGAPADAIATATIEGPNLPAGSATYRDGKFANVPVGGPYRIGVVLKTTRVLSNDELANFPLPSPNQTPIQKLERVVTEQRVEVITPVFVGDLWVLSGQSNMEGVGNLSDVTPPSDRVAALGMDGHWGRAEEPLHWLVDSPDPVHSGKASDREARSKTQHRTRTKGAGLGLPFGVVMAATTNVPVGLVACAHGGTSLEQWDPAKKGEGGNSLYGSMLRQVGLAGGKVRGVLWYQGESDAMGGAAADYARNFTNFIAAVRDDLGQAELPFYYVQIGRFIFDRESKGWNLVQDVQRQIPDRVPNTAVVASVDLELDDLIHIGTQGQKRLGTRLARIAQRELFGQAGATTPTLDRVTKSGNNLVLKFKGVNRAPSAAAARGRVPANQLGPGGNMAMGGMGAMGGGPRGGFPGMGGDVQLSAAAIGPTSAQPLEGLRPERHIAGFSLRKEDGTEIPLIHDAAVGQSKDTVILRLVTRAPEGARLWYGYGLDPYCNLTDALDMGVPVFGPVSLDDLK